MADIISGKSRFSGNKNAPVHKVVNISDTQGLEEFDEQTMKMQVRRHRYRSAIVVAVVLLLAVVAFFIIRKVLDNKTYEGYSVSSSVSRDDTESAQYIAYNDGYVRYSNDGIAYFNGSKTAVWNQTYSMQKPQVKICGDKIAVGDLNGNLIYVFNSEGFMGKVDAPLSISQIEVGKQGVVAAILEDNSANYINMYDSDGDKIYTVKTTLAGDGYPVDISISDDGTKLIASYIYVSGESMNTNVVFYNFSDVGQNETERVVGGFNHYGSTIVGDVQFLSGTEAVAVGENVVTLYKIKEYPSIYKEIEIDSEIERVFFSDEYIGLLMNNSDSGELYKLIVYNLSGARQFETTFNTQYNNFQFDGSSVVMNNSSTFTIMNMSGKVITMQNVELPLSSILTTGVRGRYILINSKYIQSIKLK
ncbi:MAG: DUF5711 family protein [Eubacteriales bacterium]|nr:DUF5711 family protein [Eubacteriales bacterium]